VSVPVMKSPGTVRTVIVFRFYTGSEDSPRYICRI